MRRAFTWISFAVIFYSSVYEPGNLPGLRNLRIRFELSGIPGQLIVASDDP